MSGDANELETRLAAARARKAAAAAQREEAETKRATLEQVEAAELEAKNEEAIAKAEAELGPVGKKIVVVDAGEFGVVILRRPNPVLFKRFQDQAESRFEDFEKLVRPCLVHPDKSTFDRILDEQPGRLASFGRAVCELAGVNFKEVAGKS